MERAQVSRLLRRRAAAGSVGADAESVEMWASRISDLVLKAAAIAERAAGEPTSRSEETRLSRLQEVIAAGQEGLARLSGEGRPVSPSPKPMPSKRATSDERPAGP